MRAMMRAVSLSLAVLASGGLAAGSAAAQSPPSLQQYPLSDRIFGSGGAVFPDYVTPYERGLTYVIGTGAGTRNGIFAAGTVDFLCQQTQVPQIRVLSQPAGGKVSVNFGNFTVTNIDSGLTKCVGQKVRGLVVTYRGPRAPGATVTLRVTYPFLGAWYDHTVPVSR